MRVWKLGLTLCLASVLCCEKRGPDHPNAKAPLTGPPLSLPAIDFGSEIQRDLLSVGRDYASWKLMSDAARWAPTLCLPPRSTELHWSNSGDDRTHGRKLYYLRCNEPDTYDWVDRHADINYRIPAGFTIVKESHVPVEMTAGGEGAPTSKVAERGGKTYRVGAVVSLFVMKKYDETTPNTDRGWVYATLNADGTTITSAGAIQSCMECHSETTKDRLFGFSKP